jgi:hypothetical protein
MAAELSEWSIHLGLFIFILALRSDTGFRSQEIDVWLESILRKSVSGQGFFWVASLKFVDSRRLEEVGRQ